VAAFRATLEEVCFADLLLFVVDCTSEDVGRDLATTREVIDDLGAAGKDAIIVWNKADKHPDPVALRGMIGEYPGSVLVSAITGEGLDELRATIEHLLETRSHHVTLRLGHDQYQVLARLHDEADVTHVEYDEEGMTVHADVPGWMAEECARYRVEPADDGSEDDDDDDHRGDRDHGGDDDHGGDGGDGGGTEAA
jgi:GTP-binding protein HflX